MSAHTVAYDHQDAAGWTDVTLIEVLLDYIDNQQASDALDDYLRERRASEREGTDG